MTNSLTSIQPMDNRPMLRGDWRWSVSCSSLKTSQIANLLNQLQAGDHLIVSELSRLGRSMLECMEILSIASQKGIHLYAVKGNWRLDNSIQSKIVAMAFSMAAEIERGLISQRTKEVLAARKKAGVTLGRPKGVGKSKLNSTARKLRRCLPMGPLKPLLLNGMGQRRPTSAAG